MGPRDLFDRVNDEMISPADLSRFHQASMGIIGGGCAVHASDPSRILKYCHSGLERICIFHHIYKRIKMTHIYKRIPLSGGVMRPTLKDELEYAIWKITGLSIPFNEHVIPHLSKEIAKKTGEDPGEVSMRLAAQIKEIIWEDIQSQYRNRAPCQKAVKSPVEN